LPPPTGCRVELRIKSRSSKCRDVLIAIGYLGQLVLKVASVGFEVVIPPHIDSEKVVVVSLSLPIRCVWVRNASDTSSKLRRKCRGMKQSQFEATPFRLEGKVRHMSESLWK